MTSNLLISPPECLQKPLETPQKTLLGPGPSNTPARVLNALQRPTLGHLHPEYLKIMDDVKSGVKYAFQTENDLTLVLSGSGHSGMEAVMANILEKGQIVLVANNGIWGERASDIARRQGADVRELRVDPGSSFSLWQLEQGLKTHRPKLLFVTHGESSTGVKQDLEGIGELCHRYDSLLAVDSVAALGGEPVLMDAWQIDVLYTGSQKVLAVPPGLTPISFSPRAQKAMANRSSPCISWYWDVSVLGKYWGCFDANRFYHHTGPVNMMYGLREGLAILAEEGLQQSWERHRQCTLLLHQGLIELGLQLFVANEQIRLATITTVLVPHNVDPLQLVRHAMDKYKLEIAGGLGPTAGKVWRIGLMGPNANVANVELVLKAFKEALDKARAT